MGNHMADLNYVRAYIDDVAILSSNSWEDHLQKVDTVLNRLKQAGLKVNGLKSFFGRAELEYLGYMLTQKGVKPVQKKVDAILKIAPPKNIRHLRSFLGAVNYYRDLWMRRAHLLTPLNNLTRKGTKWNWGPAQDRAFENIKRVMARETLLYYPNFNKPFEIHTDASLHQLGSVISQDGHPIAFYSRKLRDGQHNYTTTERELLAIVETLKEFRTILLGQQLKIYTDHKNLTFSNFNTERVMRWRMVLEEYSPELVYIKGPDNLVADALSRLDLLPDIQETNSFEWMSFQADELSVDSYPLRLALLQREQQKDQRLRQALKKYKDYNLHTVHGGGKQYKLIQYKDKIVVPVSLQQRMVKWYHTMLMHPGINPTELTIRQHFTWPSLTADVAKIVGSCPTCQLTKKTKKKVGHLPPKQAECNPWDILCIDLIGPYTIERKGKKPLSLHCMTMIDPATGWFEMVEIPNKQADTISNILEQTWMCRYPWPQKVICDRGSEFMAEVKQMLQEDYGCNVNQITTRNPQANAILERIHQTIGNMVRTTQLHSTEVDEQDPFSGLLSAAAFATRATVHTTLGATPSQLVFGRDAMVNTKFIADWAYIKNNKQKLINQNNKRENSKRKPHTYRMGDKIIIKTDSSTKFGKDPYQGPYDIVQVNDNGTIRYRKGNITDTINIRNIHPYQE